ncbi:MAG: hypothetical protein J6B13_03185 [Muribaculaceae bacterium]|nr:hypothetical protein [Muribaculaceae bacterium]
MAAIIALPAKDSALVHKYTDYFQFGKLSAFRSANYRLSVRQIVMISFGKL